MAGASQPDSLASPAQTVTLKGDLL